MSKNKKTGLFAGLGCGCLALILLVGAATFYFLKAPIADSIGGLMSAPAEIADVASSWSPPADDSWDNEDWPETLTGGWILSGTPESLPEFLAGSLGDTWAGRDYHSADGVDVALFLGHTDKAVQQQVTESMIGYTPSGGISSQSNSSLGARHRRNLSTAGHKESYELWQLGSWTLIAAGVDKDQVSDAATAFLETSSSNSAEDSRASSPSTSASNPDETDGLKRELVPTPDPASEPGLGPDSEPSSGFDPDFNPEPAVPDSL